MNKKRILVSAIFLSNCLVVFGLDAKTPLSQQLGWVANASSLNLCHGYYQEPVLDLLLPEQLLPGQLFLNADSGIYALTGQTTEIRGHVVIAEPGKRITADAAKLHNQSPKQKTIDLAGNVIMREPGSMVIAKQAHYVWGQSQGSLDDVVYRYSLGAPVYALSPDKKQHLLSNLMGWGQAVRAEQRSKTLMVFYRSNFTTCIPENAVWQMSASKLILNRETGRGVAKDMVLRVKGVPIFYSPYFNFPLDKRRQSGFLLGTYGYYTESGIDISIPYYWNIAPNYDATLTPRIMEKRGVQFNTLFRYLMPTNKGDIGFEYLSNDKSFHTFKAKAKANYPASPLLNNLLTSTDNRYLLHWRNNAQWSNNWSSTINITKVSDDYYFQDLGSNPNAINDSQLLRQADINYTGSHWNFLGRLQHVQTLHPINRVFVPDQYSRLPQLLLTGNYPDLGGFNYSQRLEFVHFDRPRDPLTQFIYPTGNRFDFNLGMSWPFLRAWGFITPSVQWDLTHYEVNNPSVNKPDKANRAVPIFSLDQGLYLTRDAHLWGQAYEQTLEPRVFYLYVPYVNQDNIPVFDSAWQPLTLARLFSTHRFTGLDRIGDANQVTLAVTSRFIDKASGIEKLKASIGQMYYFQNRRITLNDPFLPLQSQLGALSNTSKVSPIIGELNYYMANSWHLIVNGGYDTKRDQVYSIGANFQYLPAPNRLLNLGYNFIRQGDILPNNQLTDLNLSDISFAWPLPLKQWKVVGRWNYNIGQHHVQNVFSGLEYDSCCWAVRFIANKRFTAFNQINNPEYNTGFYIQVQLKGLGNFNTSNPSAILASGIPGYRDNFGEI